MTDPMSAAAPEMSSTPRVGFFARTMTRRAAAFTAGGALLIGAVSGVSSAQSAREDLDAAAARIVMLEDSTQSSAEELRLLQEQMDELTDENAELERIASEHDAVVAAERASVAELRQSVTDLEAALTTASTERDTAHARVGELELLMASQPAPPSSSQQSTNQSAPVAPAAPVYFKNCDAARAAGAAPVRVGDPGYGSHLDRDGDGVGCE